MALCSSSGHDPISIKWVGLSDLMMDLQNQTFEMNSTGQQTSKPQEIFTTSTCILTWLIPSDESQGLLFPLQQRPMQVQGLASFSWLCFSWRPTTQLSQSILMLKRFGVHSNQPLDCVSEQPVWLRLRSSQICCSHTLAHSSLYPSHNNRFLCQLDMQTVTN